MLSKTHNILYGKYMFILKVNKYSTGNINFNEKVEKISFSTLSIVFLRMF